MQDSPKYRHRLFRAATAVAFAAFVLFASPSGLSFDVVTLPGVYEIAPHEEITRTALYGMTSADAVSTIVGIPFWSGNLGSDADQASSARHYDNAVGPRAICSAWALGQESFLERAVELAAPGDDPGRATIPKRGLALSLFGEALHSLQDFYSHSNWIELALDAGTPSARAPIIASCIESALPARIQSGYFDGAWANAWRSGGPLIGCPWSGPPQPFQWCHSQLNKDNPRRSEGKKTAIVGGATTTYYQLAASDATAASRDLLDELHRRIVAKYTPQQWNTNGECLYHNLIYGSGGNCLDLSGTWLVDGDLATLTQSGTHVVGNLTPKISCPLGGTVDEILDVNLSMAGGFLGQMNGCVNPDLAAEDPICASQFSDGDNWTAAWAHFAVTDRTLDVYWTNEFFVDTTDANGNHVGCMRTPEYDQTRQSSMVRSP